MSLQDRTDRIREVGNSIGAFIPDRAEVHGYLYEFADLIDLIDEAGQTVPDHIRIAASAVEPLDL